MKIIWAAMWNRLKKRKLEMGDPGLPCEAVQIVHCLKIYDSSCD